MKLDHAGFICDWCKRFQRESLPMTWASVTITYEGTAPEGHPLKKFYEMHVCDRCGYLAVRNTMNRIGINPHHDAHGVKDEESGS